MGPHRKSWTSLGTTFLPPTYYTLSPLVRMTSGVGSRIACVWQCPAEWRLAGRRGRNGGEPLPMQVLRGPENIMSRRIPSDIVMEREVLRMIPCPFLLVRRVLLFQTSDAKLVLSESSGLLRIVFSSSSKRSTGGIYFKKINNFSSHCNKLTFFAVKKNELIMVYLINCEYNYFK